MKKQEVAAGKSLPGFGSPAAGFDQPFEMLAACHERVVRTLRLLSRLVEHIATHGCDAQVRAAATDVLRYFDIAAPKHHEDEELHVFPLLLAQGDAALAAHVERMQADHRRMSALWRELRTSLSSIAAESGTGLDVAAFEAAAVAFVDLYAEHLQIEEQVLFPAAQKLKSEADIEHMGDEMRRRRKATQTRGPAKLRLSRAGRQSAKRSSPTLADTPG